MHVGQLTLEIKGTTNSLLYLIIIHFGHFLLLWKADPSYTLYSTRESIWILTFPCPLTHLTEIHIDWP